ncbi:MAG: TetR/AcrR family transcriptional regulator [Chthonomonadales bacterium]|nr:TetR/AcrR family transcriptional regulator [Chthonomonadales bacterium]
MADGVSSRKQHAEERREQIVDAAARVFAAKGFGGASVRDIARAVGVTEGLLYHYFDSKEQLMDACLRERTWRSHLERILAGSEGKPVAEVMRELALDFLLSLQENGEHVRMQAAEMQRDGSLAGECIEYIEGNQRLIIDFLEARRALGELRDDVDLDTVGGILMGSAFSLFLLWGRDDAAAWRRRVERFARSAVSVILDGASSAPPSGRASARKEP